MTAERVITIVTWGNLALSFGLCAIVFLADTPPSRFVSGCVAFTNLCVVTSAAVQTRMERRKNR